MNFGAPSDNDQHRFGLASLTCVGSLRACLGLDSVELDFRWHLKAFGRVFERRS